MTVYEKIGKGKNSIQKKCIIIESTMTKNNVWNQLLLIFNIKQDLKRD